MIGYEDMAPALQEALAKLTEQERRFIALYCETGHAAESYGKATGETDPEKRKQNGWTWVRRKQLAPLIEEIKLLQAKRFEVTESKIMTAYAHLAFGDIREFYDEDGRLKNIPELPLHLANMVQSYEEEELYIGRGEDRTSIGQLKKIRLINRKDALDSLSRTQGLFITEKKKPGEKAKVVRFPAPVSKEDWEKTHGKSGN